jgi:hypothetical protein
MLIDEILIALAARSEVLPGTSSVITAKAANDYHFKTGQRK